MHWIQFKNIDGAAQRFVRYKCGRCGTTMLHPHCESEGKPRTIPAGWKEGSRAGWSVCPQCLKKEVPLPILQ